MIGSDDDFEILREEDPWICRNCTTANNGGARCSFCNARRLEEDAPLTRLTAVVTRSSSSPSLRPSAVGYDGRMLDHREVVRLDETDVHPERPDRLLAVWQHLQSSGLLPLFRMVPPTTVTEVQVQRVHTPEHLAKVMACSETDFRRFGADTYACRESAQAARLAAGILVRTVAAVMQGRAANGLAVIRPPGHHAEPDEVMGFCLLNNVAIAARAAQAEMGARRVMIIDWDVHHGNGTQLAFQNDPTVLYVSLHRYDDGDFYPGSGHPEDVGSGAGAGFSVNVGWPHHNIGDAEYMMAFHQVVMPIAYEFAPDLVLVSAGFDAAVGDPLGGCRVTPAGFAHMTHMLKTVAGGRLVLALEGGYNLRSVARSVENCARTLIGHAPPPLSGDLRPMPGGLRAIRQALAYHRRCVDGS